MEQSKRQLELLRKSVVQFTETPVEMVDQDEMQLMDATNETWVQKWREATRNKKVRKD